METGEFSLITFIKWSSYLNTFFLFFVLNYSMYLMVLQNDLICIRFISRWSFMKYFSGNNGLILIEHGNGSFIDNYSLKTMELIKHWKKDFYPDNRNSIVIHRIEFYSNYYLAINVEVNDEKIFWIYLFFSKYSTYTADDKYLFNSLLTIKLFLGLLNNE